MSGLIHCIYTSAARVPLGPEQLAALLHQARVNNQSAQVTGMLLYSEQSFFQILEGEQHTVDRVFERIQKDARHDQVTRIIREPIARRSFGDWTMGFLAASPGTLQQLEGLNDFFTGNSCFAGLDGGRAKKLLAAFAAGRWRSALSGSSARDVSR